MKISTNDFEGQGASSDF